MNENRETTLKYLRWTVWTYFWLLLVEGSLRKWVVPQLATPLLLVRDPVVLVAYVLAWRAGIFPRNWWVVSLSIIAGLSFAMALIPLWNYVTPFRILLVAGYGFRCNFLHLPFMFVIARCFRPEDVKKLGWWTLLILGPMALLMVAQFQTSPDSFLNRTSTGEGEMMTSALGRVRTAGPFSFVVGVAAYFALATAFLVWAALRRDVYRLWLLGFAGSALVIGIAVSGSRTVVAACALVVASLILVFFLRPSAVNRVGQVLIVILIVGFILIKTPIFKEGFNVLSTRFNEVAVANDTSVSGSLVERILDDVEDFRYVYTKAPLLGFGLGVGTNGGAKILTGESGFLLSEVEWSRIFLESGPLLGLAFVLWRVGFTAVVGLQCLGTVIKHGDLLPLLLISASASQLSMGQLGQPTILGFAVFVTGLALAARQQEGAEQDSESVSVFSRELAQPPPRLPSNSPNARRLHESNNGRDHENGFVDR
ncbi:MAG: hypothetical protein ABI992_00635 [Chthoniobacterales bacterium]